MAKRRDKVDSVKTVVVNIDTLPEQAKAVTLEVLNAEGGLFGVVEDDVGETKELNYDEMEGFPYLVFMSDKSKKAQDIANDLGAVPAGTPALFVDEEYLAMLGVPIMLIKFWKCWSISSTVDAENFAMKQVRMDEPKDKTESDAPDTKQQTGWKETFVVYAIAFHDDLAVPMPFVCTVKTVKARWIKKLNRAQDKSKTNGWEKGSDLHAKLVTVPSALRVCGTLKMIERQGPNGKYYTADANVRPTPYELVEKALKAQKRPDYLKLIQKGMNLFEDRVKEKKGYIPNKRGIIPATDRAAWSPKKEAN